MKKIISIFIATVILMMSAFSINAFADTPKTEELLNQISESNEAYAIITNAENAVLNSNNFIAFKDDMNYFDFNIGMITIRLLSVGDYTYIYMPKFPLYYIKFDRIFGVDISSEEELIEVVGLPNSKFQYVKSYEETLDGKTYYVDEYIDDYGEPIKYYYYNDILEYVVSITSDGTSYTLTVEEFSLDVDDDNFSPPKFALDVSFLIGFFAVIF